MRIIQMLPTMVFGDAVSNDAAAIRRMITEMGYETEIYAENMDARLPAGVVTPVDRMIPPEDGDLLIYHGSTGDPMNRMVPTLKGKKLLRYHNITPPQYFRGYNPENEKRTENGYREMRALRYSFDRVAAVSDYNRRDLQRMGYKCPMDVCPIVIPFSDYDREPDRAVMEKYRGDGWTNLLFVGRIVTNKKQENVIRAFEYYHRQYNPKSRLFLVGSAGGMEKYLAELQAEVRARGLCGRVIFPGQISFAAILAYYRLADVFLCMSEHEGFCVPLVEAMYFDTPIVAMRAAAIPDTIGRAGVLLENSDPAKAAAAIDRVVRDRELQERIAGGRKEQLKQYRYEAVSEKMKECIRKTLDQAI